MSTDKGAREKVDAAVPASEKRPSSTSEVGRFNDRLMLAVGETSVRSLARRVCASHTVIHQYLQGKSEPTRPILVAIADATGVNLEWLATGEGPMRRRPRADAPTKPTTIVPLEGAMASPMIVDATDDPSMQWVSIPEFNAEASAGLGVPVDEPEGVIDVIRLRSDLVMQCLGIPATSLRAIRARGDSMLPTIHHGELVLLDSRHPDRNPGDGIWVVRFDGQLLLKRIQRIPGHILRIYGDNPAYTPIEISIDHPPDDLAILARVVACLRCF
jgi:phage repressor protein C with HTH and peptisase S24 domain